MNRILIYSQLVISVLLIVSILLQQRGGALGQIFGGEDGFYATRRGLQKKIFVATILLGALFIILSLINLIV